MKSPTEATPPPFTWRPPPELERVTGRYFANSKDKRSSERSYDQAAAARLWQVSVDLVGLSPAG
jgi:retinol dehydrogenase 14